MKGSEESSKDRQPKRRFLRVMGKYDMQGDAVSFLSECNGYLTAICLQHYTAKPCD
jgi:hypothetical protein